MPSQQNGARNRGGPKERFSLRRRETLTAIGSILTTGLAGCSGVTDQSFAAAPVVLPEGDQEELVLAETVRDSDTITRSGPGGIEVSVTNQASLYRRGPARGTPTVIEQFTSAVNGTAGAGSAIVATASELGIDELSPLPYFGDDARIAPRPEAVSILAPNGCRNDGEVYPGNLLTLAPRKRRSTSTIPTPYSTTGRSPVPSSPAIRTSQVRRTPPETRIPLRTRRNFEYSCRTPSRIRSWTNFRRSLPRLSRARSSIRPTPYSLEQRWKWFIHSMVPLISTKDCPSSPETPSD